MRTKELMLLLTASSLGYFVVQLDVSIVNLSLPTIQGFYHTSVSTLQWIVNAYTLSLSILLLSGGVFGDRYGAKRFLILGYAVFFLGSLACAIAPTITFVLVARFFQGIGAAIIVPNSLAVINISLAHDNRLRVMALTVWMAFGGVALTAGPILGGIITSLASWRYIFLINLPICLLGIMLTWRNVKAVAPVGQLPRQDWLGQILVFVFSATFLLFIINHADVSATGRVSLFMAAVIALGLFLLVEARHPHPAIPLVIFKSYELRRAIILGALVNFTYFGVVFFSSLYFRYDMKMTPLRAGFAFIPITAPLIGANLLSNRVGRLRGHDLPITIGVAFLVFGMLYLALLPAHSGYVQMLPALVLVSFGTGLITPMITAMALISVDSGRSGMIAAVVNFFRQIAGAFGVAVFGLFMTSASSVVSYHEFGIALTTLVFVMLAAIWLFGHIKGRPTVA